MCRSSHDEFNQVNYTKAADIHNKIDLNSTLYLAYRDIPDLLEKHLFSQSKKESYKLLDFGCGVGLSTEIISKIVTNAGYKIDIVGIDISDENLKFARLRLPQAKFLKVDPNQPLQNLGNFDLIICNFVLVENKYKEMVKILKIIQPLLMYSGVLIITNCTSKVYQRSNRWYSLNNDFYENEPIETEIKKSLKFKNDQPVKLQFFTKNGSFTFFDFFHSEKAYRDAYEISGLELSELHKPLGLKNDGIPWKSEMKYSPYKIHILTKKQKPEEEFVKKATL